MKRFRYALDPLCIFGCAVYALNRWLVKPHVDGIFLHGHFNDLWLIPCALPLVLWLHRNLGLRNHDGPPTPGEVGLHLAVWSIICELVGPRLFVHATGDVLDVLAYAVGGLAALAWWQRDLIGTKLVLPRAGFDLLARHYRWMEAVLAGERLQTCRTTFLNQLTYSRHALVLGCGHGRFVAELLRNNPKVEVTCVDSSQRMLEVCAHGLAAIPGAIERTTFVHRDVLNDALPGSGYDLVATHFFLDCFKPDQLEKLIPAVEQVARADARWVVSDFRLPAAGLARLRARLVLALAYAFFRVVTRLPARTLTNPDTILAACGFRLQDRLTYDWGLLHADLWLSSRNSTT